MREDFLHFVWKYRLFDSSNLKTTDEIELEIIEVGHYNQNSGPDFFNSRIIMNKLLLVGNIEIHLKSSEWDSHKHTNDEAYNNVILHVVMFQNRNVKNRLGYFIPTLELKDRVFPSASDLILGFKKKASSLPCKNLFHKSNQIELHNWLAILYAQRLCEKAEAIKHIYTQTGNDWTETLYRILGRGFGLNINGEAFDFYTRNLPLKILLKYRNDEMKLEAILLGVSGLFELKKEKTKHQQNSEECFSILKTKHQLATTKPLIWKFMRLHPENFPTIRLIQFTEVICLNQHLFSKIITSNSYLELKEILKVTPRTSFYQIVTSNQKNKKLKSPGKQTIDLIIINAIIPFLKFYGEQTKQKKHIEMAYNIMEQIPSEKNSILNKFNHMKLEIKNAVHSQGLIELHKKYCLPIKCCNCKIGKAILNW